MRGYLENIKMNIILIYLFIYLFIYSSYRIRCLGEVVIVIEERRINITHFHQASSTNFGCDWFSADSTGSGGIVLSRALGASPIQYLIVHLKGCHHQIACTGFVR